MITLAVRQDCPLRTSSGKAKLTYHPELVELKTVRKKGFPTYFLLLCSLVGRPFLDTALQATAAASECFVPSWRCLLHLRKRVQSH